jgi:DNA-binding MarR family transcriptional regulator
VTLPKNRLASEALHKFLLIHRHLRQIARQMDDQGIRPRQFAVLRFLLEQGSATIGEVQEHLYTSLSTASTVISQLEDAGYVTRTRSEDDNRVVIVELTPAGSDVAHNTSMGGIALLRRRLDSLSDDQIHIIDKAMSEIMRLMEVTDTE